MFDICFIGIGRVGYLALKYFAEKHSDEKILALDSNPSRKQIVSEISSNIVFEKISTPSEVVSKTHGCTLAVTALPSSIAYKYIYELLSNGLNVVDVSYIEEDPYTLEELVNRNKVFYIPDAGFAPGFSNLYVGYIQRIYGLLNEVYIYVGGLPIKPVEPISYQITWNPVDLLEEYIRPARIVVNGVVERIDPLDKTVEVDIPGLGKFEGFYSDGLRTMIRNINAKEMYEVTIRYPGHLNIMRILKRLGFLDKEPVIIDNNIVKPIEFTARILENKIKQTIPDIAILYIVVKTSEKVFINLSKLIGSVSESATAKYTALVFAKTIEVAYRGLEYGIYPLERLHRFYSEYKNYLIEKSVEVIEQTL